MNDEELVDKEFPDTTIQGCSIQTLKKLMSLARKDEREKTITELEDQELGVADECDKHCQMARKEAIKSVFDELDEYCLSVGIPNSRKYIVRLKELKQYKDLKKKMLGDL